jgi:hypothetical protein
MKPIGAAMNARMKPAIDNPFVPWAAGGGATGGNDGADGGPCGSMDMYVFHFRGRGVFI